MTTKRTDDTTEAIASQHVRIVQLWGGPHDGELVALDLDDFAQRRLPAQLKRNARSFRLITFDDRLLVYVDEAAIRLDCLLDG